MMAVNNRMRSASVILNVDDNENARLEKTRTLTLAGFSVIEAASATAALELVRVRLPDLVLLDLKRPDISESEICRRIKRNPTTASVMVLQTSAAVVGDEQGVLEGTEWVDNFLMAPVEPQELITNIRLLLQLREVRGALNENEERFRQLAENVTDVFWLFEPKPLRLLYVNPAYEKIWGKAPQRLYKNFYAWADCIHPLDRDRVLNAFGELLLYREYEQEYRLVMSDGSERWVRDRGFSIPNALGENFRISRIAQDITASKAAAVELRMAAIRRDEFLATLAHELRNPLAPMRTAVDLMRLSTAGAKVVKGEKIAKGKKITEGKKIAEGEKAAEEVKIAERAKLDPREMLSRQIDHMTRLVDDLLDVARITQGTFLLKKTRVEIHAIVDAAVEINAAFIQTCKHCLTITAPPEPIWLYADAIRLTQVLSNLLHNAANYTPQGGAINLVVQVARGNLKIAVNDTGIGISADRIAHVFESFTQAQRLESKAPAGLGLGLSLAKRLVELHDGSIEADSPGIARGSTFTIYVPINSSIYSQEPASKNDITESTVRPAAMPVASNRLRILLVDDSEDATAVLKLLLENFGHQVAVACDRDSALVLADSFKPQVVLLDIGLPGRDGYQVAHDLQQLPATKNATLIALTGYGQQKDREQAFSSGFSHHFVKPLDVGALMKVLNETRPRSS